ncbi:MAG: SprT family zinc-dependent metalloprotease [Aestuariibacter sp.]
MSVPLAARQKDIQQFLQNNRIWLHQQVARIEKREFNHHQPLQCLPLWGMQYPVEDVHDQRKAALTFNQNIGFSCINLTAEQRIEKLENLYRKQLQEAIDHWQRVWPPKMQVVPTHIGIRKMHTKWGSCNISRKRIWLALELVKYPKECAEMVFVHELVHLLETHHTPRFYSLMTKFMPGWQRWDQILRET